METEPREDPPKIQRHKCSACYKQYKKWEHLIEHMRVSYHSFHEPKCGVCKKHCKSWESVREHLTGPLPKGQCAKIFSTNGCELCLNIFDSSNALEMHKDSCRMTPAFTGNDDDRGPEVVAMDCEMVGGGSDGSLDLCAGVCIIDEDENVIFHSYVKPVIPVTNFRYELTGLKEDYLEHAVPLMEIKEKVEEILYNGESLWKARLKGGKARLLVGHDLDHDLYCLKMTYPEHLIRDTAKYRPLMRTNLISHSLKYLTRMHLGYDIQSGAHDPYEDCVAALRLYKRMRSQPHLNGGFPGSSSSGGDVETTSKRNPFDPSGWRDLEKMSPDDLLNMSVPDYKCWCLDSRTVNS
ncbi:RNA exonuclease 4 [Ananas comosus]|uniref:RNA exonuclease 4 n=1 Tax=Ananas comosus TaxID=4615 RepID=A0A199VBQ0_ANACO|nr:RNA exonuclease 4 [Ananas comosus]